MIFIIVGILTKELVMASEQCSEYTFDLTLVSLVRTFIIKIPNFMSGQDTTLSLMVSLKCIVE